MPAPALKVAISAASRNEESAAPATIATDQKPKNQRFHRIAMNDR